MRIVGSATIDKADVRDVATVIDALNPQWGGMPYPPLALCEAAAVGIGPKPVFSLHTEPQTAVFGRNLSASVKVIADRQKGYDEEIALAVTPAKMGLPAGITAAVKPIPKGALSVEITFTADNQPALSEYTAAIEATLKKGTQTHTQSATGIGLKIEEPFHVTVAPAGMLMRKGLAKLKVSVQRNPAFKGEIAIRLSSLPKGLTAKKTKLPANVSETKIEVAAADDAAAGHERGQCRWRGEGGRRQRQPAPVTGLTIVVAAAPVK